MMIYLQRLAERDLLKSKESKKLKLMPAYHFCQLQKIFLLKYKDNQNV